jgi:hypothetical protein
MLFTGEGRVSIVDDRWAGNGQRNPGHPAGTGRAMDEQDSVLFLNCEQHSSAGDTPRLKRGTCASNEPAHPCKIGGAAGTISGLNSSVIRFCWKLEQIRKGCPQWGLVFARLSTGENRCSLKGYLGHPFLVGGPGAKPWRFRACLRLRN